MAGSPGVEVRIGEDMGLASFVSFATSRLACFRALTFATPCSRVNTWSSNALSET